MAFAKLTNKTKNAIRASLTKIMQQWLLDNPDEFTEEEWALQIGYLGADTAKYMAQAAAAVLLGLSEAQTQSVKDGCLHEPAQR